MHPSILTHGSLSPLPKAVLLTAGNLTMLYESGFLRYIKYGNTEIIRMINHLIRDQNWNTPSMVIDSEQIDTRDHGFTINYTATIHDGDIRFHWICSINGSDDGIITFKVSGESKGTFKRNRLGMTILHPIEAMAGKTYAITNDEGSTASVTIPEHISPHQPIFDIRSMRWNVSDNLDAILEFDGDLFETEDQRNWLDASFKTYCTPLRLPFPHQLSPGDRVEQSTTLRLTGKPSPQPSGDDQVISFAVDQSDLKSMPKIGIPISKLAHDDAAISMIRSLNPDFIRVAAKLSESNLDARLKEGRRFGLPMQLLLYIPKETDLSFIDSIMPYQSEIIEFILIPDYLKAADAAFLDKLVPAFRKHFPKAKIGSGTDAFFTELNRGRTPDDQLDFVNFSVNPQAHAHDMRTMTENLATHRDVVTTCKKFSNKPAHIGPVTMRIRYNPAATNPAAASKVGMPADVDARILSLYGAGWTLNSIGRFAEVGIEMLSYYETVGWRGLLPHKDEAWPADYQFSSEVYPVYIILREILKRKQHRVARLTSSSPYAADGMAFVDVQGKTTLFMANLSEEGITCNLPSGKYKAARIDAGIVESWLSGKSELNLNEAVGSTIEMSAFSIVLLEGE